MTPQASPYRTTHDDRLSALTLRFHYGQRSFATVVAKVVLRLVEGAPAILLPPEPIVVADEHYENAPLRSVRRPSEVAPRLLSTDLILSGSAFQPFGNPGTTRVVGLGIHRGGASLLYKTLYVYGDRSVSDPDKVRAFSSMPLVWERAFGGMGIEQNPVGLNPSAAGSTGLPNVIDPRGATIPGGYGPIGRYWPARSRLAGQTPRRQLDGLDLQIPEGFPFVFFHAAPPDQRVPFLAGDEWLVLDGMHPLAARIQSRLPGVRAVSRLHLPGGAMLPVQMMLDMVVLETDRATCSLVFRGMTDAATDGAIFAVALDVPQSPLVWPEPESAAVTTIPMRPEGLGNLYDTLSMDDEAQRRAASAAPSPYPLPQPRAGIVANLPGAPWVKPAPEPPPPPPPASFRDGGGPAPASVEPPVSSIPELETGIRRTVLEKVRAGEALFGEDLSGTDLSGLDLTNAVLADANLTNAKLSGAVLSGARLTGARLVGADLSRACLDGADLSRADLSRARLVEADLEGATLLDITAAFISADRALFGRARLERAKLMHASLEAAVLDGALARDAELTGANLLRVSAVGADLSGIVARDIRLENADLSKSDLSGADLTGAALRDAILDDSRAPRVKLERAALDGARMARADLSGANLKRASLTDLRAEGVNLTGADLSHATAERAVFTRAVLAGADLRQVRMADADLSEANLDGVHAQKLQANGVRLDAATMTASSFRLARMKRASLRRATVQRADFRDCDMAGADLDGVVREGANWAGTRF